MYGYNYDYSYLENGNSFGIYGIIALIVALCGAIVLHYTFLSKGNEKKFKGFLGWLYEFLTFKKMLVETILKFLYLFSALYVTLISFQFIDTSFILFLAVLIIGNVITRIIYEITLLLVLMYRNLVEVNKKIK